MSEMKKEVVHLSEDQITQLKINKESSSINLNEYNIQPSIVSIIPESLARKYEVVAIDKKGNSLYVAMADPTNIYAIDDIRLYTNYEVKPVVSTRESILKTIDVFYTKKKDDKILEEISEYLYTETLRETIDENLLEDYDSPIVKLLNFIIQQAIEKRASDIHIEPFRDYLKIRYRIDGELREVMKLSKTTQTPLTTRVKIIGHMDIADKRIPQDGRIEYRVHGKIVDMRISTVPTIYGEKIVLRLLDRKELRKL